MDMDFETKPLGYLDCLVLRHVVDKNDVVNEAARNVGIRALERQFRVICGHDHDNARTARGLTGIRRHGA
jgi:hypothetical protein